MITLKGLYTIQTLSYKIIKDRNWGQDFKIGAKRISELDMCNVSLMPRTPWEYVGKEEQLKK